MNTSYFKRRSACPVCSAETFETIYERPYDEPPLKDYLQEFYLAQGNVELEYVEGATYVLCECDACNAIFQRDIPNDELMERLYTHWIDPAKAYRRHRKRNDLTIYASHAQEIMQIIAHLARVPASLRFLDFGMGWGEWALMARGFGCDAYGSDISSERVEHTRRVGIKVISWDEIPQHEFDFINTEQVFEHIPEPLQSLRHLKRGLKRNGLVKISVPNGVDIDRRLKIMDWSAPKGSRNSLNPVAPLEHINLFRRSSLLAMAREAAMDEVFIPLRTQYRYTTDWGGLERAARKVLLPLQRNVLERHNYVFLRDSEQTSETASGA